MNLLQHLMSKQEWYYINELLEIWQKTKVTIFFVTHNIREAVLLSEKIIVFETRPGKIKATYSTKTMNRWHYAK